MGTDPALCKLPTCSCIENSAVDGWRQSLKDRVSGRCSMRPVCHSGSHDHVAISPSVSNPSTPRCNGVVNMTSSFSALKADAGGRAHIQGELHPPVSHVRTQAQADGAPRWGSSWGLGLRAGPAWRAKGLRGPEQSQCHCYANQISCRTWEEAGAQDLEGPGEWWDVQAVEDPVHRSSLL